MNVSLVVSPVRRRTRVVAPNLPPIQRWPCAPSISALESELAQVSV